MEKKTDNKPEKKQNKSQQKQALIVFVSALVIVLIGIGLYQALAKIKNQQVAMIDSQEQFVGIAQVSEQLQDECQKSATKLSQLSKNSELSSLFAEYRQHAENCREVFISTEESSLLRGEGTYPDLIVDIARMASQKDKSLAIEMLNYAKKLSPWEFYMGPIMCSSKATIEAYLEALSLPEENNCLKADVDKDNLANELKNKNFSILSKTLNSDRVVFIGSLEADSTCPQKVSLAMKLIQNSTGGNVFFEEEKENTSDDNNIRFVYKTKDDDRAVLVFSNIDQCLKLQSVLIPEHQVNE